MHIDPDPLKTRMPLWYIPAEASYRADAATALGQILEAARGLPRGDSDAGDRRAPRAFRRAGTRLCSARSRRTSGRAATGSRPST